LTRSNSGYGQTHYHCGRHVAHLGTWKYRHIPGFLRHPLLTPRHNTPLRAFCFPELSSLIDRPQELASSAPAENLFQPSRLVAMLHATFKTSPLRFDHGTPSRTCWRNFQISQRRYVDRWLVDPRRSYESGSVDAIAGFVQQPYRSHILRTSTWLAR